MASSQSKKMATTQVSSKMAAEGQIDEEDLNISRNMQAMFDCAPYPYIVLSQWTWKKRPNETLREFIQRENILGKNGITDKDAQKIWWEKNGAKIDSNSLAELDVTFLHDFLPMVCEGKFIKPGKDGYEEKIKDVTSVEYHLKDIKELRNNIFHHKIKTTDETVISTLEQHIAKCLEKAGEECGVDSTEIKNAIGTIEKLFEKIKDRTYTLEEKKQFIQDIMKSRCNEFLNNRMENLRVPLPGDDDKRFDVQEVFCDINISQRSDHQNIHGKGKDRSREVFPSSQLVSRTQKFNIIGGESGSGKTTIMRMYLRNLLIELKNNVLKKPNDPGNEGVKFILPIHIECRKASSDNLEDYLIETFAGKLNVAEITAVMTAFQQLDGIRFLIDGYDEVNAKSRKLIESVIDYCLDERRRNVQCIATARVQACNDFVKLVDRKSNGLIRVERFFVEKITEMKSKLNLVRKYEGLYKAPLDAFAMRMTNLDPAALDMFSSPILIAIFCSLCDIAYKTQTEVTLTDLTSVYDAIYEHFVRNIESKLSQSSQAPNITDATQTILDLLCQSSFEVFREQRYHLSAEEREGIVESCSERGFAELDIEGALTCVLSPEISSKGEEYYQFYHASIQELLAAKWVLKKIYQFQSIYPDSDRHDLLQKCFGGSVNGENDMNR